LAAGPFRLSIECRLVNYLPVLIAGVPPFKAELYVESRVQAATSACPAPKIPSVLENVVVLSTIMTPETAPKLGSTALPEFASPYVSSNPNWGGDSNCTMLFGATLPTILPANGCRTSSHITRSCSIAMRFANSSGRYIAIGADLPELGKEVPHVDRKSSDSKRPFLLVKPEIAFA